tara:strand:+ start:120 stop:554 length:435 start_codon:yes stop_codon:yes gene_type:complete
MKQYLFLLFLLNSSVSFAVPVIPNFGAAATQSRTETRNETREIIQSYSYNTGYTWNQSGTNIQVIGGGTVTPQTINGTTNTVNGITSRWKTIDLNNKPQYEQVIPGAGTQYSESLIGPGLAEYVHIDRTIETHSITDTSSVFSQ